LRHPVQTVHHVVQGLAPAPGTSYVSDIVYDFLQLVHLPTSLA